MIPTELPKTFDPAAVERETYDTWLRENCFVGDPNAAGEPYSIVIPPPNVTGALHLGHAINNTLQDILIRQHRMAGFNTVWIPGLDHAGIATQAVVEKRLKEDRGLDRHQIGRDGLVDEIWKWKQQFGDRIISQLKRLGCSCDWSREHFTLDERCAKAVRETFFKLFRDGLVYRGKRLVNWDTHLQTSISDDEIYHENVKTYLWHIKYEIVGNLPPLPSGEGGGEGRSVQNASNADATLHSGPHPNPLPEGEGTGARPSHVTVATTRPETLLGDTAVAVHSQDARWNWAIGLHVELPLTGRRIPIIADDILVDPTFGSGVVKVTPAHDPNDYAVWQRHQNQTDAIDLINLMNPDGTLNAAAGLYAGLTMAAARKKVVGDLGDALVKEEPYETQVGHSDRSKTAIQPYLSDQWFVKMAPLAEPALEVVRDGTIKFFPERHAQQYLSWLGEKRDWPISRQLWWGHRIPVWRNKIGLEQAFKKTFGHRPTENEISEHWQKISHFAAAGQIASRASDQMGEKVSPIHADIYICVKDDDDHEVAEFLADWDYVQDPDVLDTWFSSALWPHSTLGWPDLASADLAKWYPTSVLMTGRDIITLWVARMVMMGMYNMGTALPLPPGEGRGEGWSLENASTTDTTARSSPHPNPLPEGEGTRAGNLANSHGRPLPLPPGEGRGEGWSLENASTSNATARSSPHPNPLPGGDGTRGIPFPHVSINPTILDGRGERMSKSKGNGVDPVDIIDTHGADALRFTLTTMATETQDVRLPVKKDSQGRNTSDKFDLGRNFATKLWNAARFALTNLESTGVLTSVSTNAPTLANRWIVSRFNKAVADADAALAIYRFDQYATACYDFFWRDLCDWYLEAIKPAMRAGDGETANTLAAILDGTLRLLHPVIPFITERLWWELNRVRPVRGIAGLDCKPSERLIKAAWPTPGAIDDGTEHVFLRLQAVITAVRNVRSEYKVDPKKPIRVQLSVPGEAAVAVTVANRELIESLSPCVIDQIGTNLPQPANAARGGGDGFEVFALDVIDPQAESQRLAKQRESLQKQAIALRGRLANPSYADKAPAHLVQQTRDELATVEAELVKLGTA